MTALPSIAIALQTLISAGTFLVAKRALVELTAAELSLARFAVAAALFAVLLLGTKRSLLPPRGQRARIVTLGVLAFPLNQGLFLAGLAQTTPSHAAFMYALTPATVLMVQAALGRERLTFARVTGVLCALGGVACVLFDAGAGVGVHVVGDVLVLGAMACWSLYTVLAGPVAREVGALPQTSWALLWGALLSLPAAPLLVRAPAVLAQTSSVAWACVLFLAALSSVAGYVLWSVALRALPPSRVAVFTNLQPVGAAALSAWLLGERLSGTALLGGALVVAGIAITQRRV